MNTDTLVATDDVQKRNQASQQFFTAYTRLALAVDQMREQMRANLHVVAPDYQFWSKLIEEFNVIERGQIGFGVILDQFLPPRPPNAAEYDKKFVRAGHQAENRLCDHKHYRFEQHGRICTCGTMMCDFGD